MWPAWPMALWTLWRWRRQWSHRHLSVPTATVLVALAANLAMDGSDRALMLALPGLAVLAAFALPTLRRSAAAAIDWFSVCFFTLSTLLIWVIFATNIFAVYAFFNWLPTVLASVGLPMSIALRGSLVFNLGGVVASVLVAFYREQESHALFLLQQEGVARIDLVNFASHGIGKEPGDPALPESKMTEPPIRTNGATPRP